MLYGESLGRIKVGNAANIGIDIEKFILIFQLYRLYASFLRFREVKFQENELSIVNQLWDACAQSIRDQVSDGVWNSTFKEARPLSVTNDELVLTVPSQWDKDRVEGPFKPDAYRYQK